MKYSLDALDNAELAKTPAGDPDFSDDRHYQLRAFFSGLAGWPRVSPPAPKAAWLNIMPEFNPFKYNSFPTNAARQSFPADKALQKADSG